MQHAQPVERGLLPPPLTGGVRGIGVNLDRAYETFRRNIQANHPKGLSLNSGGILL